MKTIAIIPARSGSKGLKDKNIKDLCGKPLIAYTIEAALESKMFDSVMVSTDSEKYAEISRQYSAEVPFLRSEETSRDTSGSWDVVREVLARYKKRCQEFDTVMLLQPTSPLRTSEDIINAFQLKKQKNADAVISVCEMDHSPLWSNTLPDSLSMKGFIQSINYPRQQLPIYYRINGAVYLVDTPVLYKEISIYENNCYAYIMPRERSVDIDTEFDFFLASQILESKNKGDCYGKTKL